VTEIARDDELPIFRPRTGAGGSRPSPDGTRSFRNAILARLRGGTRRGALSPARVHPLQAHARRVVVKAHLLRMGPTAAKAAALHVRYIERDGVEKDGSKGTLYDAQGTVRARVFEQPRPGEKHQFRFIVSPEDGSELDLTAYVRRLMATLERDVGRKVEWAAVNHFDTSHPHVHIVVRGIDRDGRELRIDRGYISAGMRWRAQELATDELGQRPERDVRRAQEREVTQQRFTTLDRELERRAPPDRLVEARTRAPRGRIDESLLIARLEHLEGLRLAERVSRNAWRLVEGWQKRLRDHGSRGDILQQIHAAVRGDPSRYNAVRPGQALPPEPGGSAPVVTGRVAGKGLSDELKGTFYVVVETPAGRAYHVPIDARSAQTVGVGDLVSLATPPETPVRPADRQIAEAARAQGGVLAIDPSAGGEGQALVRRLREHERVGLVAAVGPGLWKVPPDLVDRLAERARDAPPRHRLVVRKEPLSFKEQVVHQGPVWLDRVETKTLAHWGLGADVQQAVAERREALRRLGIGPDDPNTKAKLRELERRGLGVEIAARSGLTFLARAPEGFRGRIQPAEGRGPPGAYTVVSDGERFVVLRSTPALRALQGQSVAVARDAKGRLVVRPGHDHDIGR
jgi:type IV secretory pathway VirD2 relaxase